MTVGIYITIPVAPRTKEQNAIIRKNFNKYLESRKVK